MNESDKMALAALRDAGHHELAAALTAKVSAAAEPSFDDEVRRRLDAIAKDDARRAALAFGDEASRQKLRDEDARLAQQAGRAGSS